MYMHARIDDTYVAVPAEDARAVSNDIEYEEHEVLGYNRMQLELGDGVRDSHKRYGAL